MPTPSNGAHGYQVHLSKAVGEELRALHRKAAGKGQGEAFVAAFRRIVQALRQDPLQTGEPTYRLPMLRLQMRIVAVAPLVIVFAVSEDHPIVYIKSGRLLSS